MENNKNISLFEGKQIRRIFDEKKEIWYFSLIDIISVLTEQEDYKKAQSYWTTLKSRLKKEGSEFVTNCDKLKLVASDGKILNLKISGIIGQKQNLFSQV